MKLRREFHIPSDRQGRLQVLSSGGGTQSNCLIVLIARGLIPMPDIIVMADTEREASEVFDYQAKYIKPICDEIGLEYAIVKKSDWTDADITYGSNETVLPPFYTEYSGRNKKGEANKQPGYCSDKWKKVTIHRFLNSRYGEAELARRGYVDRHELR